MRRNKTEWSNDFNKADSQWLRMLGFHFLILLCFCAVVILAILYADTSHAAEPPPVSPYQIPAYDGHPRDFKAPVPAMATAPTIDGDVIFTTIAHCVPEEVPWTLDIKAVGGARATENNTISTFDSSGLSRYYVGIVAEMPLYSATEINRERQMQYTRRAEVAANIQALLKGLADRRRAQRELGLYASLEARSQARVAAGIVEVSEQVAYLEKVAAAQATLDSAAAQIEGARLALVGQCRDTVAEQVNDYLKEVTR